MSEYILTTEEISRIIDLHLSERLLDDYGIEKFEAWLAEVKAQEAKAERERIVKMLEDGAVLCAGGCGCFVDGGEGDPTCTNCY